MTVLVIFILWFFSTCCWQKI